MKQQASGVSTLAADDFLDFVGVTGSPAHTVAEAKRRLAAAGFQELTEGERWELSPGGLYFTTQQGTSICAFAVGGSFSSSEGGALILGAHTDSPCLKLRPRSKVPKKAGTLQLGVDTYGGGLWHTWFDRPLGLAGTVLVSKPDGLGMEERLVRLPIPLCIIPNLAIHLTTPEERNAFSFNKETQLRPVLCKPCGSGAAPPGSDPEKSDGSANKEDGEGEGSGLNHHAELLEEVARELGVAASDILDVDLCFMDATPSQKMGPYVSSPRIDNVLSTWAVVDAIITFSQKSDAFKASKDVAVICSFDHEEVGSVSASGANSALLGRWLDKALHGLGDVRMSDIAARSFLLSCDCAHGLHPNYADKYQTEHQAILGKGAVIKSNANQRYATTPVLAQMIRQIGREANVPVQEFVVRNDCPCGSTIGPLLSAQLGIRTVDVGAPQWAMHSIRETAHGDDCAALSGLCLGVFEHFRRIDGSTSRL